MQKTALRRADEDMLPGLRPITPVKQPAHSARGDAALDADGVLRCQEQAEICPLQPGAQLLVGAGGQTRPREDQLQPGGGPERADGRLRGGGRVPAADDDQRVAELRDPLRGLADRQHRAGHHALRRVQPAEEVRAVRLVGPQLHMRVKQVLLSGKQIRQTDAAPYIRQFDVDHRMRLLFF